jgi:hypothetical protein
MLYGTQIERFSLTACPLHEVSGLNLSKALFHFVQTAQLRWYFILISIESRSMVYVYGLYKYCSEIRNQKGLQNSIS